MKELHQFVAGELYDKRMLEIEQHIGGCRWCRDISATIEESQRDPIVEMMRRLIRETMELDNPLYDETIANCIQVHDGKGVKSCP